MRGGAREELDERMQGMGGGGKSRGSEGGGSRRVEIGTSVIVLTLKIKIKTFKELLNFFSAQHRFNLHIFTYKF